MKNPKKPRIKLIPFMPFDFAQESVRQAHHERNQLFPVRPELVEGHIQRFSKNGRQAGFSLLEVLVAFSVLALCLGVLLRIFSGDGRLAGLAEGHSRAVVLAQSLMAKAGVETPLRPGEYSGDIDEEYSWRMRVTPFIPPGEPLPENQTFKPYWVELVVEWGDGDELRSFSLGTLRLAGEPQNAGFGQPGFRPR